MLNIVFRPHRSSLMAGTAEPQKLFAMVKMLPDSEVAGARPPLAFALVIDTSGSMREFADQEKAAQEIKLRGLQGQQQSTDGSSYQAFNLQQTTKLDQAIEAARRLINDTRLLPTDKVTIIHFDTEAATLVPLTPVSQRQTLLQAIDSLRDHSGQTFMAKGMTCAEQQLCDLPKETAKRVVLLTDGATQQEGQCRRLAGQFAEANTPVIAIGIGPEYKEKLMLELADVSQGKPYHLDNMSQFQAILDKEVGSSVQEVITDLQATVKHVKGVSLKSCTRVYPSLSEVTHDLQPLRLGNVAAGDYTVFILEFALEGLARPPSRVRIAQVNLAGSVPGLGKREEFAPQDLFVSFTNDEAAIAAVDADVLGYVQQKNMDNLIQKAMDQATVNAGQARQTLQVALGMTQRIGNPAMTRVLNNALDELNKSGTISAGTRKTVVLGGRTKTVKTGSALPLEGVPSEDEIRKISGV
jgi:Ca-activated chloride channel family protein